MTTLLIYRHLQVKKVKIDITSYSAERCLSSAHNNKSFALHNER